ncbi:MAG: glycerol-3-phosphate dehydrogenase/oxidase [Bacteroidetes bacterium]|nr:glycerol-3-phosphate dehydrogenase/oxidase [Bacteroidota bacterium]
MEDRKNLKEIIRKSEFDLLIIGGGITGAGIALDASSRGLKTVLVEKGDFSSGTSSKSTKLIHGGLRYLKQFEIALVREVGHERTVVHQLASHLVTSEKMLLPLTEDGTFGKLTTSVGLMVYDILAGVESADQRVMLSKEETLEKEPLLNANDIIGSGLYAEYRTDDSRLTIEAIKTALKFGAVCINYVRAVDFIYNNNKVSGAHCQDSITGEEFVITAKKIISAAGPWVDELRDKDGSLKGKKLHLTKGVHIVFDRKKFPLQQAIYFDVADGRMIFAIPRGKTTYVGTTDTDYSGNKDKILTERADAQYLVDAVNSMFNSLNLTINDISSSWAGVRPLIHEEGKSLSELSRKDEIFTSESNLLSMAGGKLTGYRKMSERIVDLVMEQLSDEENREWVKSRTKEILLEGGPFPGEYEVLVYRKDVIERLKKYEFDDYFGRNLVATYGRQADQIIKIFEQNYQKEGDNERLFLLAELDFCVQNEMVVTALDFIVRRSGRLYFDIENTRNYALDIVNHLSKTFNWTQERQKEEMVGVENAVYEASDFFKN